jgi:hypothetical protein
MSVQAKDELRMPANEFDRIMRRALQAPPPPKSRATGDKKKARVKRSK